MKAVGGKLRASLDHSTKYELSALATLHFRVAVEPTYVRTWERSAEMNGICSAEEKHIIIENIDVINLV
jgi:hypothetical protein